MRFARSASKSITDVAGFAAALLAVSLLLMACGSGNRADADRWEIEGSLLAWEAGVWIVDTVPIVVPDDIALNGAVTLGATVTASGGFDAAGRRVARQVSIAAGPVPESTLPESAVTGPIERIDGNFWVVDGREVVVASGTSIRAADAGSDLSLLLQIGNIAEVAGNQLDDQRIVARDIVLRPTTVEAQPDSAGPSGTAVPPAAADQPEQPDPAPTAPGNTETEDGDDDSHMEGGEGDAANDDKDNDDRKNKDIRDIPEKPDKPDKPDKDNGREKDQKD